MSILNKEKRRERLKQVLTFWDQIFALTTGIMFLKSLIISIEMPPNESVELVVSYSFRASASKLWQ